MTRMLCALCQVKFFKSATLCGEQDICMNYLFDQSSFLCILIVNVKMITKHLIPFVQSKQSLRLFGVLKLRPKSVCMYVQ